MRPLKGKSILIGVFTVSLPLAAGFYFKRFGSGVTPVAYGNAMKTSTAKPAKFDWKVLQKYDYKSGTMPENLKSLNHEFIKIPGFMVPLEDDSGSLTEFLLVPNQMGCIHVPPPPPNFTFYVTTHDKKGVKTSWEPVWITGQLSVGKHKVRGDDYFLSLDAIKVEPYEPEGESE